MKRALGRHLDMRHLYHTESVMSRALAFETGCDEVAADVQAKLGDRARLVVVYPSPEPVHWCEECGPRTSSKCPQHGEAKLRQIRWMTVVVCVATLGMDHEVGDDMTGKPRSVPHHQTSLTLKEPGPGTRADCSSIQRPCPLYRCIHHNWPQTERPGRPHSGRHNLPVLRQVGESCTLDVADRGWHTNTQVGLELGVTKERVRQIVDRATDKMAIAQAVLTGMEDGLRSRLYQRALVTFDYHRVADPNRIVVTGVIVPNDYDRPAPSVLVRKRGSA